MVDKSIYFPANFKDDFHFLFTALQKHPAILLDQSREKRFAQQYQRNESGINSYDSLINAATELTSFFQDGHTNIEVPYSQNDLCIPLPCGWDEGGSRLILNKAYDTIPAHAQITAVNDTKVETLISLMANKIPHENLHLVKSRMILYPYQNYHLFSERNLRHLFGKKDTYTVTFLTNGEILEKKYTLQNYNGFLDFADEDDFMDYEIQDGRMILHLNSCIYNEKYKTTLETLADLCRERQITSFVLDLSRNMGGNSAVIDEFIKYIDIDSFRRYEMIDYSSGEARQISSRQVLIKNPKKPVCLPSDLCCKVSCHTFSSARTFAVTLKDNGLAKIIGTETGGKPNSYGMPKKMQMPESKIRFRVSTSYFMRPDSSRDNADTLAPD
jgi:hypothetical protein